MATPVAVVVTPAPAVPGTLAMTSREIAELTGKNHADVLRDIRTMLEQLEITASSFAASYQDSTGRTLPMFALTKDLTITLVSGYSVPMRHRIVTRWMELEAKEAPNFGLVFPDTRHHGRGLGRAVGSSGYPPSGAALRGLYGGCGVASRGYE